MKKVWGLIIFSVLLLVNIVYAESIVVFTWDANTESDLIGYRLYQSDTSGVYNYGDGNQVATISAGTEKVAIYTSATGTEYWTVTAYNSEGESDPSNEVSSNLVAIAAGDDINLNDAAMTANFTTSAAGTSDNKIKIRSGTIIGEVTTIIHPYWELEDIRITGKLKVTADNFKVERLVID